MKDLSSKSVTCFGWLLVAALAMAFSFSAQKKDSKRPAPKADAATQGHVDTANAEGGVATKTAEDEDDADASAQNAVSVAQIPKVVKLPPRIPSLPKIPPPVTPTGIDNSILKIQQQIKEIIKLNDTLKLRYADRAAEIQRISEQARIHQHILEQLQKIPKSRPTVSAVDTDEILRQEKIRLIRDETKKNHQLIQNLNQASEGQET